MFSKKRNTIFVFGVPAVLSSLLSSLRLYPIFFLRVQKNGPVNPANGLVAPVIVIKNVSHKQSTAMF
jgi:hypothetical protein